MAKPLLSKRKADAFANGAFFIALGIILYEDMWWPWILLAIWIFLSLRQFLTGRLWDFFVSSFLLLSLFIISFFRIDWSLLAPIIFVIGGIYVIFKEFFFVGGDTDGEEKVQEMQEDIEEAKKE